MSRLARRSLLLLVLASLVGTAYAQDSDQLYLIAFEAPLGSISSGGQGQTGVYVRWDTLEGALPPDLVEFELRRDGTPVATFPAAGFLSDSAITALYTGVENERRLFEIVRWLNEEDGEPPMTPIDLGAELRQRVLEVAPRALLASRIDFNIARARHRGYLDTGLANGTYTWELLGNFLSNPGVRLGRVTLTVDGSPDIAPAAENLSQVSLGRCDAPERTKDHYAVALNWKNAGASVTDEYAVALAIAGYDLYRSSADAVSAPPRDLRAEAALLAHDTDGNVLLAGLEKVNDQPIVVAGTAQREDRFAGFDPEFAQFLETQDELAAAGMAPGSQRAYYLVARDQSGNYGATTQLLVQVADTEAPATPWQLRGFPSQDDGVFRLTWPHVDTRSYYARNLAGRTYCNLDTARLEGALEYVTAEQSCEDAVPRRVDLAVTEYLVYRFQDDGVARRFTDSDGDGFDDQDERPGITDPGTACDSAQPDPNTSPLPNYRVATVPASNAVTLPSGQVLLEFADPVPAQNLSRLFWYRVASRDEQGNVSSPSELVPGLVADRRLPVREDELGGLVFGRRICAYFAALNSVPAQDVGLDLTSSASAQMLRLACDSGGAEATPDLLLPIEEHIPGARTARLSQEDCQVFMDIDGGCAFRDTTYEYLNRRGEVLASVVSPGPPEDCPILSSQLVEECDRPTLVPIGEGEVVPPEEGPWIEPPAGPNCLGVFRDVGAESFRLTTLCPGDPPFSLAVLPDLGGDRICLKVASYNENAQMSAQLHLPCFRRPGMPQPPTAVALDFQVGGSEATASLLHAERPAIGALIEWQRAGDPQSRRVRFVPRPPGPDLDLAQQVTLDVGPEPPGQNWQEEWCFRGLSIGGLLFGDPDTGFSGWSESACGVRQPLASVAVQSLPWPRIPPPPFGFPLEARLLRPDDIPMVLLSNDITPTGCVPTGLPLCDPESTQSPPVPCTDDPGDPSPSQTFAVCPMCAAIQSALTIPSSFVAYRQWRDPGGGGAIADFVQVSPLVEPFCITESFDDPFAVLDDPFVSLLNIAPGDPWQGFRLVFTDRSPYRDGQELRYQFVFFRNGEIVFQRTSGWITP